MSGPLSGLAPLGSRPHESAMRHGPAPVEAVHFPVGLSVPVPAPAPLPPRLRVHISSNFEVTVMSGGDRDADGSASPVTPNDGHRGRAMWESGALDGSTASVPRFDLTDKGLGVVASDKGDPRDASFRYRLGKACLALTLLAIAAIPFLVTYGCYHDSWENFTSGLDKYIIQPLGSNYYTLAVAALITAIVAKALVKSLLKGFDYLASNKKGAEKVKDASQYLEAQWLTGKFYWNAALHQNGEATTFIQRLWNVKDSIVLIAAVIVVALGFAGYFGEHDAGMKSFWDNKIVAGFKDTVIQPMMDNKLYMLLGMIAAVATFKYVAWPVMKKMGEGADYLFLNSRIYNALPECVKERPRLNS